MPFFVNQMSNSLWVNYGLMPNYCIIKVKVNQTSSIRKQKKPICCPLNSKVINKHLKSVFIMLKLLKLIQSNDCLNSVCCAFFRSSLM